MTYISYIRNLTLCALTENGVGYLGTSTHILHQPKKDDRLFKKHDRVLKKDDRVFKKGGRVLGARKKMRCRKCLHQLFVVNLPVGLLMQEMQEKVEIW